MPIRISSADIARFASRTHSMKAATDRVKHKVEGALRQVVRTTELNAVAFGASVLKGKVGEIALLGVPVELAVGLGGHLLGFFGIGGNMNHHLHNLADGSLVAWTCGRGLAIGHGMRTPADAARIQSQADAEAKKLQAKSASTKVSGENDGLAGQRLTPEELKRAVAP